REILKDFFKEPYNAVIVTHARENFTYENINMAFRLIVDGAVFISSSLTRYFKDKDGLLSLDAGAFTYALMYATGKEPIILGKPSKDFFISSLKSISLDPQEVVMIGDDIENDIKPAIEMGIKTVLVKTGKFRDEDLLKGIKPNYVVNSISDVLDFIS
ncbi:MAG TPA: HAD hydrolase-like protein, partial [Spirochaetota bacterium]|nr:HAD hydrolase-like protein [Spirochaetota bacterium]